MTGPESIKLLAPHSINLEPHGGIPEITSEDISHCLGTCRHRYASLVLRVKYAGQHELKRDLFIGLYTNIMENGGSNWLRPRNHWVWDLCKVALDEFLAPSLCPACNGLGTFLHESLKIECRPCLGTGKYRKPNPADVLEVSHWQTWDKQYREILAKLSLWEDIGISVLNRLR